MLLRIIIDMLITGLPMIPVFLGVYTVLRIREDFDLTIDGSFPLGAAATVALLTAGLNPILATLGGVLAGACAGLFTATCHVVFRVPILLMGLITSIGLFTVTLHVLGDPTVSLSDTSTIFGSLAQIGGKAGDFAVIGVLAGIVGLVLVGYALFLKTDLGLALRSSGNNAMMARSLGVNEVGVMMIALVGANGLAALGGALLVQQQGFADVNMGLGTVVAGVGAVLLGELLVRPGGSRVLRIVLAVLIGGLAYRLILVASLRAGLPAADLKGVTALTLLIAIAAQRFLPDVVDRLKSVAVRRVTLGRHATLPTV